MPPLTCPRCRRLNPADASFCYFDGAELRSGQGAVGNLAHEFVFPSGRRCRTYDELASGCQEEWPTARDLLRQGVFKQFFTSIGRMDLARSSQEAMGVADLDMALTRLVDSLPVTVAHGPKLDLQPRRLVLGAVFAGESRQVPLTVTNRGKGTLQGTVSVVEGGEWLRLGSGQGNGQYAVKTTREQQVVLQIDTRGLAAGKSYGAKLTVVTNGGLVEVPAKIDVNAHPFHRQPFQGVRTPRELAERMRANPKAAAPLLESGELHRWFGNNGWNYPVRGTPVKGVAGVQQFFECMGLSKPPPVQLSQPEVQLTCMLPNGVRGQIALQTRTKKWVYASVRSLAPWLRVLTPEVAGPQQAIVTFEIDPAQLPPGRSAETTLQVVANASQKLSARVRVDIQGSRPVAANASQKVSARVRVNVQGSQPFAAVAAVGAVGVGGVGGGNVFAPIFVMALVCLLLRMMLVPVADLWARPYAVRVAAGDVFAREAAGQVPANNPARSLGGWLELPWFSLLLTNPVLPESFFGAVGAKPEVVRLFKDSFISHFIRTMVLWTWWLGAFVWPIVLLRRGGSILDAPWGAIAGAVLGAIVSATFACLVLVGDMVPHLLWGLTLRSHGSTWLLPVWVMLAVFCWMMMGAVAGLALTLLGPIGRTVMAPFQVGIVWIFRICGLTGLATFCAPA